ncbi:endoribonuclease L-PSP [Pseudomonas putida]|nr:endoribonuclease L-PSP [Pseudomonas putida]
MTTTNAPAAIGPYSQAIRAGDTLYLSGQLPIDPATGSLPIDDTIESQTRQSLENIKSILAVDGLKMSDIVSTTVYLTDLEDFGKMNEVYGTYFSTAYPARVTVGITRLPKGAKVEIASVANRHK